MANGRELSDKTSQLNVVDGLRGFAALTVFMSHTSNAGIFLLPWFNCEGIGKSGVFLFFVLSSFLLTRPFIQVGRRGFTLLSLASYVVRRFTRIYPMYLLYIICGLVTSFAAIHHLLDKGLVFPFSLSFREFVQQIDLSLGKGVTWSILVEFRYYFFLPLVALAYAVVFRNRLFPCVLLTVSLAVASQLIWPAAASSVNDPRLGPYLPIFFMGGLLALIHHHWQGSDLRSDPHAIRCVRFAGLTAFVALLCMSPSVASLIIHRKLSFDYNHRAFIIFGLLWSTVVFSCLTGKSALRSFFELPPLRYLGFISFSFYLWHVVALWAAEEIEARGVHIPAVGWLIFFVTVAVSDLTWRLIEKPASRIRLPVRRVPSATVQPLDPESSSHALVSRGSLP